MLRNINPFGAESNVPNDIRNITDVQIGIEALRCFNMKNFEYIMQNAKTRNKNVLFGYMSIEPKDYSAPIINSLLLQNELGNKEGNNYLSELVTDIKFAIKLYMLHLVSDYYTITTELVMNPNQIQTYEKLYYSPLYWIKLITKREVHAKVFGILPKLSSIFEMCKLGIIEDYDSNNYLKYGYQFSGLENEFDIQKLLIIVSKRSITANDVEFVRITQLSNMLLCSELMIHYEDKLLLIPNCYNMLYLGSDLTCAHNESLKKWLSLPYLDCVEKRLDIKKRFESVGINTENRNTCLCYLEIQDQELFEYSIVQSQLTTSESQISQENILYLFIVGNRISITMFDNNTIVNYAKCSVVVDDRLSRLLHLWKPIIRNNPIITDESISRLESIMKVGTKVTIPDYQKRSVTSIPNP